MEAVGGIILLVVLVAFLITAIGQMFHAKKGDNG